MKADKEGEVGIGENDGLGGGLKLDEQKEKYCSKKQKQKRAKNL